METCWDEAQQSIAANKLYAKQIFVLKFPGSILIGSTSPDFCTTKWPSWLNIRFKAVYFVLVNVHTILSSYLRL